MPNDVQQAVEQIDKEPAQPAAPAADTASTATADPDDAEVAAAQAEAEAEAKGAPAASAPGTAPVTAAAPAEPAKPATPAPQSSDQPMIPKARLDEVLAKSAEKDTAIARLQGENEALKLVKVPAAPGAQPAQQAQPTPDEQLKAVRTERLTLAKRFDDGEIGLVAYETEKQKLEDREEQLREARLSERLKAQTPAAPQAPMESLGLEERTRNLESKHPYVQSPEVMQDDHWQFLLQEAANQLQAAGVTFPKGPLPEELRYQLREKVCQLSDVYGPIWGAKASAQPQQQPAPPKTGLSPQGQARQQKLEMAQDAPPDVNRLTPAGGEAQYTDDMIAGMSDDEILKLPASIRARFAQTG